MNFVSTHNHRPLYPASRGPPHTYTHALWHSLPYSPLALHADGRPTVPPRRAGART